MPFDLVILFLGIHPEDFIQEYVNALYTKLVTVGVFITGKKGRMRLSYCRGMIQETIWTLKGKQKSLKYCLHAAHSTTTVFVYYNMKGGRPAEETEDGTKRRTKQQKHTWERMKEHRQAHGMKRASSGRKARVRPHC